MGNGDPCLRVMDGTVWRATHTPLGVTTQRLGLAADGSVAVDAWGPGAEWLIERAPALCGALDLEPFRGHRGRVIRLLMAR
jgi:hypothetical protein